VMDADGTFTPNAVGGPFGIMATSGMLSGTASVHILPAPASVMLSDLIQAYDGQPKTVKVTTNPPGLPVEVSYNGVSLTPTMIGTYMVTASITDPRYAGMASGTFIISGETLAGWQSDRFSVSQIQSGAAADTADPDGDGLLNLAEYALGTDPHESTPAFVPVIDSNGLTLIFKRPKGLPDVIYAAESSTDMITWNPVPLALVEDGMMQTVRASDPLSSGDSQRRFIRLRFTRPP
jgi:hypothetical protein